MTELPEEKGAQLSADDLKALGMKPIAEDLTLARDERVIPFVSNLLKALGEHNFEFTADKEVVNDKKEDASYNSFYTDKFMPSAIERDLRVHDMAYTFGLAKKVVEMLQARSTQPVDEMRVVPCALEILGKLGSEDTLMLMSDTSPEDGTKRAELYDSFYHEIVVQAFLKHEVEYNEVLQVFATMSTILSIVEHKTAMTIEHALHLAESKLWGIEDKDDVTLRRVHAKCIEPVDKDS